MSSGGGGGSKTTSKTTSETKPVENSDKAANEAAQNAKAAMTDKTESSESTILTSGKGILDEPEYKRNLLGAGLLSDVRGQRLG